MIKYLILLLLSFQLSAQTVVYQPSTAIINNPEIGFYHYTSTSEGPNYNLLSLSTLNGYKNNENIVVIQRQFFLKPFITGIPITQAYLNNVQADFNTVRSAGAKIIVRFTYTSNNATVYQPTKAQILAHIQQLVPVINANKDVIVCIQAGFIGQYGEWYYTNSTEFGTGDYTALTPTQWTNRKEIMDAMINSYPVEIPLQLRYIYAKQKMYGNTYVGRIGFYNDAFLAVDGDGGTFLADDNNPPSTADVNYWIANTVNNPVTGETNAVNSPRTDCSNTLIEMNRYNWSLINKDYYPANITNWQTNGCYLEMQKKLGYRFELNSSDITNDVLRITLTNTGYANLFKERKAYLIFKNTITNVEFSFLLDSNVKNWTDVGYQIATGLQQYAIPNGTYKLYMNIPDPLNNSVIYSIQMANIGTWIPTSGYNDLQQTWVKSSLSIQVFVENNIIRIPNLKDYTFKIYNINGKLLKYNSLDISGLQAGVYILKIKTADGMISSTKIVKS